MVSEKNIVPKLPSHLPHCCCQPTFCWHESERRCRSMLLACVTALRLGNCCQHTQILRGGPVVSYYHHIVSDRNSTFSCTPSHLVSCHICSGPALHLKVTEVEDEIDLCTKGCQRDCQAVLNFRIALTPLYLVFLSLHRSNYNSCITVRACFLSSSLISVVVVRMAEGRKPRSLVPDLRDSVRLNSAVLLLF